MQRAGLAVARLALAIAPHAQRTWIACGPGNNGGDGLEAAMHLQRWGKQPVVSWLGDPDNAPPDAATSHQRAVEAGVTFTDVPPDSWDLCIDALLGIGAHVRAPTGRMADWINRINTGTTPVLAVDLPTGLHADTGHAAQPTVNASHTLSLLTLKPGLFTAHGRDAAGIVWLDDLGVHSNSTNPEVASPTAWLAGVSAAATRLHASHKGSYGDVAVVGGAPGMTGAALLAASAALHAGAGRVFVGLLDGGALTVATSQAELMFRPVNALDFKTMTVVCGCGGGDAVRGPLSKILSNSASVVIDADALNAIANDVQLQTLLSARGKRAVATTVLTPHPLEAARLLGITAAQVQQNRLATAQQLAQRFGCTVVLKGSGTVIAAPGQTPVINPTGNARLATAGTGDVLAGMVGARLAGGLNAFEATCQAVYQHGLVADRWRSGSTLVAGALARHAPSND
jgi:hydroxyethylthiazole kinase-like uncharacterized protein yjeF